MMKSVAWSWLLAAALCAPVAAARGTNSQLLQAAQVAQTDFSAYLRKEFLREQKRRHELPRDPKATETYPDLWRFLADVDNYEMRIWREKSVVVVEFHPRPPKGVSLRGGGGAYRIDRVSLRVIGIEMWQ